MLLLLLGAAHAEVPLPSYRRELARMRWYEVNATLENGCELDRFQGGVVCAEGVTERARAKADAFQDALFHDAGLEYLVALSWRYDGQASKAEAHYRAALALDDDYDAAWYDLGELYVASAKYDKAEHAFTRVSELVDEGPQSWLGPWRLAEVAALQHDAATFEAQIKIALQRGFSFQQVAGLPNWKRFYADPALRDTLDKLLTVYAEPEVRRSLQEP